MILVTALITGILNIIFIDTGLIGASGIVFILLLLVCFTNVNSEEIPITFNISSITVEGQGSIAVTSKRQCLEVSLYCRRSLWKYIRIYW